MKTNKKIKKAFIQITLSIAMIVMLVAASQNKVYAATQAPAIPGIETPYYIVVNTDTGEVIAENNADVPIYPASTAKIMCAMAIMDVLPMETLITVDQSVLDMVEWDASKAGLKAGDQFFAYELMCMYLIPSGADAGYVLAQAAYGSVDACVNAMNLKAIQLGLTCTHFDNVVGLDISDGYYGTFTTARDYSKIAMASRMYPWITYICFFPNYVAVSHNTGRVMQGRNTNGFINGTYSYSQNLYIVTGLKTGFTDDAGQCLAATATNGAKNVLCVSYGNPNKQVLYDGVRQMLDYAYMIP